MKIYDALMKNGAILFDGIEAELFGYCKGDTAFAAVLTAAVMMFGTIIICWLAFKAVPDFMQAVYEAYRDYKRGLRNKKLMHRRLRSMREEEAFRKGFAKIEERRNALMQEAEAKVISVPAVIFDDVI